jgi:outer membrane protein TolC
MINLRGFTKVCVLAFALAGCSAPVPEPLPVPSRESIARLGPVLADTEFGQSARRALLAHPVLAAGSARIDAAMAGVTAARAATMPRLSLGADVGANLLDGSAVGPGILVVQVSQLLFDAGATRNRIRAAEAGAIRETIERENSAAALGLTLAESWGEVRFQRLLLSSATENHAVHRSYLEQIETRLAAGAGTEADILTARSRTADAAMREITTRGQLERAEARFAEVFGVPPARLSPLPSAPVLPSGAEAAFIAASPRIRSLEAEIAAARASAEAVRASRFPAIGLRLDGSYDPRSDRANAVAGLNPRVEIGPGSERAAAISRSAARVTELEAERTEVERQIQRSLAFLQSDQRSGRARVEAARVALEANRIAVEASEQQFTIGRRTLTQLLDARRDLYLASEALALAERDLALSGYAALALTGDILDALGVLLPLRAGLVEDET